MPVRRLTVGLSVNQVLLPALIAILGCGISLWLTINFCRQLRTDDSPWVLIATGALWELAKMHYAPTGLRLLAHPGSMRKVGGVALCLLSLVLLGGSVVASLGYLVEADAARQQRVVASSHAYREAQAQVAALNAQINLLIATASVDATKNFRERALQTSGAISTLRNQKNAAVVIQESLRGHPETTDGSSFFTSLGSLVPGDASLNARRIRFGAHATVALMLELISIAALALLRTQRPRSIEFDSKPHLSPEAVNAPQTVASVHRINFNAKRTRPKRDATGRGDTSVQPEGWNTRYNRARELVLTCV